MITQNTIEKIKRHTDIVAVITPFVKLTKKGTSFRGLCPFHEERNPSFSVSPAKGIYKCFSCGETGDAIGFLMRHEAMSFGEALRWLAAKAGIEIEEQEWDPQERQRHEARECFFLLNEMAAQHFSAQLHRPEAQRFLALRDIDAATAERFALGFASPSEDGLKRMLTRKGYPEQLLLDNGLLCVNPSKGAIDRFRNRLIFPIRNVTGRVVAFGGRLLENHDYLSKYHNSPETPFYSKGRELYGLFEGKKAIAQEENCFVVEGYTDVLRLSALGVEETVAPLGTALTREQAKLLKRFTPCVTIMTDGDEAGRKSAWRMLKLFLTEGFEVYFNPLPANEDPDSYGRSIAKEVLKEKLYDERQDAILYFAMQMWLKAEEDPSRKARALQEMVGILACVSDPVRRLLYVQKLADMTGFRDYRALDPRSYPSPPKPQVLAPQKCQNTRERAERRLISYLIFRGSEQVHVILETGETWKPEVREFVDMAMVSEGITWENPLYRRIWEEMKVVHIPEEISYECYYLHHPNEEIAALARELTVPETEATDDPMGEIRSLMITLKLSDLDKSISEACRELIKRPAEESIRSLILNLKREWHTLKEWMQEAVWTN